MKLNALGTKLLEITVRLLVVQLVRIFSLGFFPKEGSCCSWWWWCSTCIGFYLRKKILLGWSWENIKKIVKKGLVSQV